MTPVEAIHTATRDIGPAAGIDSGQIAEGFLADLLLVDGDPTQDVTVLQRRELRRAVLKDGAFGYVNPARAQRGTRRRDRLGQPDGRRDPV